MDWSSEAVRDRLCALVTVPGTGRVSDAGCGDTSDLGRLSRHLGPEARVIGVERSKKALGKAQAASQRDALDQHGLVAAEEYARLVEGAATQAERGEYFYSATLYIYVGRKL